MVMTYRIEGEDTERDVIDTPWVQRLRRIFQLQSARWVFSTAEHTRFQHSLGTMHVASCLKR
jgi:HD superfamily phosphohydrolase